MKETTPKNSSEQIMLHIARAAYLTGGNPDDFEIWISRFAELLGCDERAGAVAVAIESLIEKADQSDYFKRKYFGMVAKERAAIKRFNP